MQKKFHLISLGQGQGQKAEKILRLSSRRGEWVMLENCHLMSSWMNDLDRIYQSFDENTHRDFRYYSRAPLS